MHVEELDAEPDILEVLLAGNHEVEAVGLILIKPLLVYFLVGLRIITFVEQLLCQFNGLHSQVLPVCELLTDFISTGHGPFWDFALDGELDVHLVVYLESTIDGFDCVLIDCLAQLAIVITVLFIAFAYNFSWIQLLHVLALL